jgi:ABC-type polar amino acid transport system ATPase subunit
VSADTGIGADADTSASTHTGEPAIVRVRALAKCHGERRVLDGVSLDVRRGEVAVVIGPSGGGKSTLLRCLNGFETFDAGELEVLGTALRSGRATRASEAALAALRRRAGMVFQQFHLFPHLSALENVLAGPLWVRHEARGAAEARARALLERVGLAERLHARPAQLSGGEQQRVAIARALALEPELLLFDEPTSALDPLMAQEVTRVMLELARAGQTMVVVTHALDFARAAAHTVHILAAGRIVESGPASQVLEAPRAEIARTFLAGPRSS